ncbi:phosphate acetyltransferase [Alteromonas aestuariivivens]|uniref:Phosphate acetyltransferase n=1 Tax=Alteromonas aestuariivivens TaxID=1938339 RepID=A0A3D8M303_9ALTE|nr:phosphate acetyltransferase [Alteromonas aestuariivivens]RDV24107.1 phosphate acetyltransferase [Alteromonas aestuariivivens]
MSSRIMLIPVGAGVGLTSVSLGMVRAMEQQAVKVDFFKPVAQLWAGDSGPEKSSAIIHQYSGIEPAAPIDASSAERMLSNDQTDELLEEIIHRFEKQRDNDTVAVIEGLVPTPSTGYAVRLNKAIASALNAKIVLVCAPGNQSETELNHKLEIAVDTYGGHKSGKVLGCIFNKVNAPLDEFGRMATDLERVIEEEAVAKTQQRLKDMPVFKKSLAFLGCVSWDLDLIAPRVIDLAQHLNATFIHEGDYEHRRLRSVQFCAREIHNMTGTLKPGALLVVSGDRSDVIVTACLAALNGTKIGAILLTGGFEPDSRIWSLCQQALDTGLPVMLISGSTWETAQKLTAYNHEVPIDDAQRVDRVMSHTASCIDKDWIASLTKGASREIKLSPAAFRYHLTEKARAANKRIVLPEGNEPRTVKAAAICAQRNIAQPVLLGNREEILRVAEQQGVELPDTIQILQPEDIRKDYVLPLAKLREHKGVTEVIAEELLHDDTTLATMMLQQGHVDGLVSGAVNTTANTIRPALQLIKTAPNASLVSSVFFMLLPEQVLVYGDCAINPDPTAEELADIAIQSADSAATFGITPKVAMISYSTGDSGSGSDVEKVKKATQLAQQRRPDLLIDGPLQYDAAVIESVGKKKAPNSPVAGQATVFIFPDLNTGNTTYKAVQRSFDLVCIGPMLQGMNKPVNDLSRGALVDDIVFTIAITAIQASDN